MRVEYTKYHFIKPEEISEQSYLQLKKILNENPNHNLIPKEFDPNLSMIEISNTNKYEQFEKLLSYTILCGVVGGCINFLNYSFDGFDFINIISAILICIPLLFIFGALINGDWYSYLSYKEVMNKKNKFYERRKRRIICSENYLHYIKM